MLTYYASAQLSSPLTDQELVYTTFDIDFTSHGDHYVAVHAPGANMSVAVDYDMRIVYAGTDTMASRTLVSNVNVDGTGNWEQAADLDHLEEGLASGVHVATASAKIRQTSPQTYNPSVTHNHTFEIY